MYIVDELDKVVSREQLAKFVSVLAVDLTQNPDEWENKSLGAFLEGLSGWIADMDGYYLNNNLVVPDEPNWRVVAEMLIAARSYE